MEPNPDQLREDFDAKYFAYDTYVTTPEGDRLIQNFQVGDSVLAFSAKLESGKIKLTSSNAKVSFSDPTPHSVDEIMILMYLERADDLYNRLICTLDQYFLLSNGKYTRAKDLQTGQKLVDKDGNSVKIMALSSGDYQNGGNSLATDAPDMDNPNGHLLLVNGVIVTDFAIQVGTSDPYEVLE